MPVVNFAPSVSLIACKFVSLSIYQIVNLLAFQLVSFSACAYCFGWLYLLSECSLASPGSPCTNLEADDCKYEYFHGDHCCCGQCPAPNWLSLACVFDSTTGAGLWQPTNSLCPAEGCGSEGESLGEIWPNQMFFNLILKVLGKSAPNIFAPDCPGPIYLEPN